MMAGKLILYLVYYALVSFGLYAQNSISEVWAYITIGMMVAVSAMTIIYSYGIFNMKGLSTGG